MHYVIKLLKAKRILKVEREIVVFKKDVQKFAHRTWQAKRD